MNSQEGILNPFARLRRGLDGLVHDAHGIMLNVAPVTTKYLSLDNLSARKINPAFAGKYMTVGCAGIAAEPVKARQLFGFLTRCKVLHTCRPLHCSNF